MVQSYFLFVRLHDTCRTYSLQSNLKTVGLSDTRGPFLFMIKLTTMNYRFIIIRFSRVSFIDVILFSNSLLQSFLAGIYTFGLIYKKMEGRLIHTHFTKKDQIKEDVICLEICRLAYSIQPPPPPPQYTSLVGCFGGAASASSEESPLL